MSDVFISYSRRDKATTKALAEVLEGRGLSVWWDREILPGSTFDQAIEQALGSAACVVVLWSRHSVASDWVKVEAAEAARRGVLVPVLIDSVEIPLEFRRVQTADLSDWRPEAPHPGLDRLLSGVAAKVGGAAHEEHAPAVTAAPSRAAVPRAAAVEKAWSAELIARRRAARTLEIQLSRERHVLEYRYNHARVANSHAVRVDGETVAQGGRALSRETRLSFELGDGEARLPADVEVLTRGEGVVRFHLRVGGRKLYGEPR